MSYEAGLREVEYRADGEISDLHCGHVLPTAHLGGEQQVQMGNPWWKARRLLKINVPATSSGFLGGSNMLCFPDGPSYHIWSVFLEIMNSYRFVKIAGAKSILY